MSRSAASGASPTTRTIGDILLERGFVTSEKLEEAVKRQEHSGKPLGQILVEEGAISRLELASALAEQWSDIGSVSPEFGLGTEPSELGAPLVELQELRNSRRVLEERLRAYEELPLTREDEDERALLASRLAGVEAAVAGLQEHDVARDVIKVRQLVDKLSARVEELAHTTPSSDDARAAAERVGDVDRRLAALGAAVEKAFREMERRAEQSDDALGALATEVRSGPAAAVDGLARRVAALEPLLAGLAPSERVDALEATVQALARAAAERPDPASAIDGLGRRLDALAGDVASVSATHAEVAALGSRVDEIAAALHARVEELAVRQRTDGGLAGAVDELTARVDALSSRPVADGETDTRVAELAVRLDHLGATVEGLGAAVEREGGPAESDPVLLARLDGLTRDVSELRSRPSADPDLAARHEALAQAVGELQARPTGIDELRAAIEALTARVDAVADRPAGDPRAAALLDALQARIDVLEGRVDDAGSPGDLVSPLDERIARLEHLEQERSAQLEGVEALAREAGDLARERAAAGSDALSERLAALERGAAELGDQVRRAEEDAAGRLGSLDARLDRVAARLDEPERARVPVSVSDALAAAGATGDDQDVERLRMMVERLMHDFAEHRRAVSSALSSREFTALLEELAARVDELQAGGVVAAPGGNGAPAPRADVRALATRLDEVEESVRTSRDGVFRRLERMMGTIDWRLQRLEHPESIDDER